MYARRRWSFAATPPIRNLRALAAPERTMCPACRQVASGQFSGEVRVSGTFATAHRAEVERLIRNEVRRASEDNPLGRIVRLDPLPEGFRVRTTTEHLAKRIGQSLHKAFRGKVRYRFSEENKFAHVTWRRDL
jgi:NMD protein affecting ribosome stability and mRNA decay